MYLTESNRAPGFVRRWMKRFRMLATDLITAALKTAFFLHKKRLNQGNPCHQIQR
jgi:hypothetical protein